MAQPPQPKPRSRDPAPPLSTAHVRLRMQPAGALSQSASRRECHPETRDSRATETLLPQSPDDISRAENRPASPEAPPLPRDRSESDRRSEAATACPAGTLSSYARYSTSAPCAPRID